MELYLETQFVPNQEELNLLEFVIGANNFPWYYQRSTSIKYMFFGHTLMTRNDELPHNQGHINSNYYEPFANIFLKICKENNIEVNTILRGSINATGYFPDKHGDIHCDHEVPHKNFILYLNDCVNAPTYIFNKKNQLIKTTTPCKYKAVFFCGPHAQGFCAPYEHRFVLVFTFI